MISDRLREQQISPRNEYNFSKASPSGVPRSTKGSASFSSSSTGGASLGGDSEGAGELGASVSSFAGDSVSILSKFESIH